MLAGPSPALGRHFPDASIENTFMKKRMLCLAGLASLAGMPAARLSHAEQGLLWELGAGAGTITLPDYLGSDVTKTHLLPIPYVTYRGEFFRVDRNGLRGLFFQSELLEINVSMNLALGGSSRDNPARQGMADLKPTGEVGPTVDLTLWQASDQKAKLDFRMPVRAGITVESSPKLIGWLFSPHLQLALSDPGGLQDWHATLQAGPIFNSRRYDAHFYSVTAPDVNAFRPAYAASGGYAGSRISLQVSKRFQRYWVGALLRYDTLKGAVFQDSPLVKRHSALTAAIGVAWVFSESSIMVSDGE